MYGLKLTIGIPMLILAFTLALSEPETTPWTIIELMLGAGIAGILHLVRHLYQCTKYYKKY